MTHHHDASREGSGTRVDPSRSSTHDVDSALAKPVLSSSPDLETLARLARAVPQKMWFPESYWVDLGFSGNLAEFIAACSPERILGLIEAAQQQQQIVEAARRYVTTFLDYSDGTKDLQACDRAHDQARDVLLAAVAAIQPIEASHAD